MQDSFNILVERSAKHAARVGRELEIFYEASGPREDREIVAYLRALKREGMPFDPRGSAEYQSLAAETFRPLCLASPTG